MSKSTPPDDPKRHAQARQLAEDALGAYASGNPKRGDALAEKAAQKDRSAVVEVVEDLDEDAGSNPEAAKRSG